jgi:hypothetical protein
MLEVKQWSSTGRVNNKINYPADANMLDNLPVVVSFFNLLFDQIVIFGSTL